MTSGDGIVILEAGLSLGGGTLQSFGLNSNTSANGFLKCMYKKAVQGPFKTPTKLKNQKADLEGDSSDDQNAEAAPPFKDLYKQSPLVKMTMEFGLKVIPLSAVGMLFNFAGNHLLHYIAT